MGERFDSCKHVKQFVGVTGVYRMRGIMRSVVFLHAFSRPSSGLVDNLFCGCFGDFGPMGGAAGG